MWLGIHREWLLQAVEVCAVVGGVIICTKVVKSKQEIKVVLPRQNYKKGLKLKKKKNQNRPTNMKLLRDATSIRSLRVTVFDRKSMTEEVDGFYKF